MPDVQMLPTLAYLSALVLCACGRGHLCSSQVCMAGNVATPGCTGRIRCLPAGVAIHGGTARGSRRDCCRCHHTLHIQAQDLVGFSHASGAAHDALVLALCGAQVFRNPVALWAQHMRPCCQGLDSIL